MQERADSAADPHEVSHPALAIAADACEFGRDECRRGQIIPMPAPGAIIG
jgi:hypothetical protein